jgi:hypothetical protein
MTVLALLALGLSGCGGSGNDAFVPPTKGTGGNTSVASLVVTSSIATIPSDSSAAATITAQARDANNSAVAGASVTFSTSAGTISGSPATTDANGNATVTLTAGTAAAGTSITVTATAGTVSNTAMVTVANTKQTITLETSSPQIPSDGLKPATITALVRDAKNNFVSGATVAFTSTSGGLTVTNSGTTDANGSATATLTDAGDPTSRTINVTASVGNTTATIAVAVIGTSLSITGGANLVLAGTGTYTVALTDSSGNGIAAKTVAITSSMAGNTLTPASVTTDATGHGTFTLLAKGSGTDTLTATALGETGTFAVAISSQSLIFTTPAANTLIDLSQNASVSVTWTSAGVPQAGKSVAFASTRGTLSVATATTNGAGVAAVTVSSTTAGPAVISASGTGVTSELNVDFVATVPASLDLQASPATVPTQGQSTITAIVRDAKNNLVQGQTVDFTTVNDVTGGTLSVASSVTDDQGKAQTVYTASNTTSAKNGVVVDATVQGTAVTGTADLTVGGQTVFLSLGTGNTITALNSTQYELPYAVQAIDAAGNAVNGANVTLTVISVSYEKGAMAWNGTNWAAVYSVTPACPSEDENPGQAGLLNPPGQNNGILDPGEDGGPVTGAEFAAGYRVNPFGNHNGKLDPGLVASVSPGSLTTANGGSGLLNLIYPKDHAYWVSVTLVASTTVQGTQASTEATFLLPGLAGDYSTETIQPPGPVSPYGQANTCVNPN